MDDNIIEINNLSYGYTSNELVIDQLSLNVPEQSIYGFLGSNGAGKTTTLKMLLNLIKNYQGDININGKNIKSSYPDYLSQIGSLIETPSFYGHLSAIDNLRIWSKYFNTDQKRIPELLEQMDLNNVTHKKVEHFSTGMKQRLGIASALLHDPKILILDEPTNGLDPMGMIALREILLRLKREGKTILISSHILSEVEKIVSHIGILKHGSLIYKGSIGELQDIKEKSIELLIQVDNVNLAFQLLNTSEKKGLENNVISVQATEREKIPLLLKTLIDGGVKVYEFKQQSKNLESMFLTISKENQN